MGQQQFISNATKILSQIDTHAQFIVIHNYQNNYGEVASYSLCWRISYENAVLRSLELMKNYKPTIKDVAGHPYTLVHLEKAREELIESYTNTLTLGTGNNPEDTSSHAYDSVFDRYGKNIPGVKIHREEDVLHLNNVFRLQKVVHVPGVYKEVKSAMKTLAKNALRNMTPLAKMGQFKLAEGRFDKIVVSKISLIEEDMLRI
jgi:hypothetical protein